MKTATPSRPVPPRADATPDRRPRSRAAAYTLWLLLGFLGAHRLYMGRWLSGLLMATLAFVSFLLTVFIVFLTLPLGLLGFAALGLWWLIDAFELNTWLSANEDVLERRDRPATPNPTAMM